VPIAPPSTKKTAQASRFLRQCLLELGERARRQRQIITAQKRLAIDATFAHGFLSRSNPRTRNSTRLDRPRNFREKKRRGCNSMASPSGQGDPSIRSLFLFHIIFRLVHYPFITQSASCRKKFGGSKHTGHQLSRRTVCL